MARIKPQALLQQSKKKKGPNGISAVTVGVYALVLLVMAFFIFLSYKHWTRRSSIVSEIKLEHTSSFGDSKKSGIPKYAVIDTAKGSITVELYKEGSPQVVDEFIKSCEKGVFKGMAFNRVIKTFAIQGGDVSSSQDWTLVGKHHNQVDTSVKHEAFMVGTSKTGKAFDLVITTAPIPDLNEKINVFGRVVKGQEVVQEIEEAETDDHYQVKLPIKIAQVTLKQNY